MKTPTNTSEEAKRNPVAFLEDAMVMGSSWAILHQEAQGQAELINSEVLPTDRGASFGRDCTAVLEGFGIKFGEVVEGDPLFQHCTLPQGWKKVATNHSMGSLLVDDKGRERASIFYKAAFYDRKAHMNLKPRFCADMDYDRKDEDSVVYNVTDCGKVVYSTEPMPLNDRKSYEVSDEALKVATAWLDEHWPDWKNPAAYWD